MDNTKLWSGRFHAGTDPMTDAFNSSLSFDVRLAECDVRGSIAHVMMLERQGIITPEDGTALTGALNALLGEIAANPGVLAGNHEDVHMAVEAVLTERIGDAAKRIHTARSRNDQVALDMRLYARDYTDELAGQIRGLVTVLRDCALKHLETLMPGYTHMQQAQTVTLAHHICAYIEMLLRDLDRLTDLRRRINVMPLGSGALASTSFDIDREYTAGLLGFSGVTMNSLDAVSDRDYAVELVFCLSLIMTHLSRFCEEIIIWSTSEFGYVSLPDAFSTGSSMMPQKKNPDVAELIRGKTGRVFGSLTGLLCVMKGLPLAYNKDMQEDKEQVFDAMDTVMACVRVFSGMFPALTFNAGAMRTACERSFMCATDLADYLVRKGAAFRDAHFIVGGLVKKCSDEGRLPADLTLGELQAFSQLFGEDAMGCLDPMSSVRAKKSPGSPNPEVVGRYLESLKL